MIDFFALVWNEWLLKLQPKLFRSILIAQKLSNFAKTPYFDPQITQAPYF